MRLNNYSVQISQGQESKDGYVLMQHGTKYTITLTNNNQTRCNVLLEVDGKPQGTIRINAQSSITLERPIHVNGQFTFYKADSAEGHKVGLNADDPNAGLIKAEFIPEKMEYRREPSYEMYGTRESFNTRSYGASKGLSAGGTGLSGSSNQSFKQAERIDLDESKKTTIHLRLVAQEIDEPRSLTPYSNPIPPAIQR